MIERRLFLKFICLSALPVISNAKIHLFDTKEVNKNKKTELKKELSSFLNKKTDKELLTEYIGESDDKEKVFSAFLNNKKVYTQRAKIKEYGSRRLKLYNPHTKEKFNKIYYSNGKYKSRVLTDLDYFMRDFRDKMILPIDNELVDLMYSLQKLNSSHEYLSLLSGYRTPKTNKKVGGAKHSQHMRGKAVDLSPPDTKLVKLKRMQSYALNQQIGGVGFYKRKRFIHVDTGPIRKWNG